MTTVIPITSRHGDASKAKERLFICQKAADQKKAELVSNRVPRCHASIPVELTVVGASLDQVAGDPQFTFVLCRVGTNKNGDHFTAEELAARYMTAINKKIDLKHSQDFTDIVGGIISADFVEDDQGGHIECTGELYTADSQHAQLANKLIRRGIITQVSMECDYQEGECSVCGKKVASKSDYCVHLRKYKGSELQGKPVFEILHGVTFTGLGLLDRKGADENARILKVAATHNQGDSPMEEKPQETTEQPVEAARKKKVEEGDSPAPDNQTRVKELERENRELKQQIQALQKRLEELEAEKKSAANRARANRLLRKLEKAGMAFTSDDEREHELSRLAGLSDEAYAASEAAFERMLRPAPQIPDKPREDKVEKERKPAEEAAKATCTCDSTPLRSDAGIRPRDVEDKKHSLEERLKNGFLEAYRQRIAVIGGDSANAN